MICCPHRCIDQGLAGAAAGFADWFLEGCSKVGLWTNVMLAVGGSLVASPLPG